MVVNATWAGSMSTVRVPIPRLAANSSASATECSLEYREGISTPCTWSGPSASTATTAVNEESIPPDSPTHTSWNPDLRT